MLCSQGGSRALAPVAWMAVVMGGWVAGLASAQTPGPSAAIPDLNPRRILGVIPNYQTVSDPNQKYTPMTTGQKWKLALTETIDPFNLANVALGSGSSQWGNRTPKYGEGGDAFVERFGAAWGDLATQNFFSAGVLATLLHQDPRYFRRGPKSGILSRLGYSISRVVVTRQDSGGNAFNASGIGGMVLGIAASNAYYPSASVHGYVMLGRLTTSLTGSVTGNLLAEFWPDVQQKFLHRKKHDQQPAKAD